MKTKTLTRNLNDRIIAGVCSGMADYFEIEPWIMRLLCVLLLLAGAGFVVLLYILFWIIMPAEPRTTTDLGQEPGVAGPLPPDAQPDSERNNLFLGLLLIVLGLMFLVRNYFYWFSFRKTWPVLLIALGVIVMISGKKERGGETASPSGTTHSDAGITGEEFPPELPAGDDNPEK